MIKPFHGTTNYRAMLKFTQATDDSRTFSFGWGNCLVETLPPDGFWKTVHRISYKNDEVTFVMNHKDKIAYPIHVTNIIEGIDEDTFVRGSKRITKPHSMTAADERLYKLAIKTKWFK